MATFAPMPARTVADAQRLIDLLLADPAVAGRLHAPQPRLRHDSGALMVYGTWTADPGDSPEAGIPAIAKVGTPRNEVEWMRDLFRVDPGLVPALYASGLTLGDEPLAWMVSERCPYTLGWQWQGAGYGMLMEAGVRFYLASRQIRPRVGPSDVNSTRYFQGIRTALTADVPPPVGAEALISRFDEDWAWVLARCTVELCHGDLHPGNAVARRAPPHPEARALLIDFAPGALPWVYEPAYCSIVWWFTPTPNGEPTLVHAMAAIRERYGLAVPSPDDLGRMATLLFGWHALRFWHHASHRNHHPKYEAAARRFVADAAAL